MTNFEKIKKEMSVEDVAQSRVVFDHSNAKWTGKDILSKFDNRSNAVQAEICYLSKDNAKQSEIQVIINLKEKLDNALKNQDVNNDILYDVGCDIQKSWEEYLNDNPALYDSLCDVLSDYENPSDAQEKYHTNSHDIKMYIHDDMFAVLSKIQRQWHHLTGL